MNYILGGLYPTFSLCHATRRLPDGWKPAALAWREECDRPESVEYILGLDELGLDEFPKALVWPFDQMFHGRLVSESESKSAGAAWNAAVRASTGHFIITVADDLFPPPHWDTEILKLIPDLAGEYVLAPDLSGDYAIITFCFLTRAYLKRLERDHGYQGGAWYPEYFGMRADTDFTHCARMDQVVIEAPQFKVEHRHPEYGTAEWDDTYRWQHREEAFEVGNRVLARRIREGFKS